MPTNWFGLNPNDDEDSVEEIASSDDGKDEKGAYGEYDAPEDGADNQPQVDRASSNEPRASSPTAADGDQAMTRQTATPPDGAADSTKLPDPAAAPLA